jgi:DNA-binding response OmpR family regulator
MVATKGYEFGEYTLDIADRRLSKGGITIHVAPKALDLLVALAQTGRIAHHNAAAIDPFRVFRRRSATIIAPTYIEMVSPSG